MRKVSVIVVCLNASPDNIHGTFRSIINQTYSPIDLVVVDGGSDAATIGALNCYLPRINQFVSEADDGIYDAMNKGVRLSSGEWLLFLNVGDTFHAADSLSALMHAAGRCKTAEMIYGKPFVSNGRRDSYVVHFPPRMRKWYFYRGYICHQAMLAKKSAFCKIGGFDSRYKLVGDRDWLLRFIARGLSARAVDLTVIDYRADGASSNFDKVDWERKQMVAAHFPLWERCFCELIWMAARASIRIKTGNFSLPFAIKRFHRARRRFQWH